MKRVTHIFLACLGLSGAVQAEAETPATQPTPQASTNSWQTLLQFGTQAAGIAASVAPQVIQHFSTPQAAPAPAPAPAPAAPAAAPAPAAASPPMCVIPTDVWNKLMPQASLGWSTSGAPGRPSSAPPTAVAAPQPSPQAYAQW